jgi:hypothetical protein
MRKPKHTIDFEAQVQALAELHERVEENRRASEQVIAAIQRAHADRLAERLRIAAK